MATTGSITLGGVTSNPPTEKVSSNRFASAADRLSLSPNPASRPVESQPALVREHFVAQAS